MMSVIGALSLVCFVLANPLSILAQNTIPAVLDTSGQPLRSGTQYYILPNTTSSGGGVTFVTRNPPCPLFVGQGNSGSTGLPVVFTPFAAGGTTVRESADFTIRFAAATTCIQSTEWALESNPASTQRTLITTRSGNTNPTYLRIDRDGNGYKLVFCPSNCPICRYRCGDVGVYVENGKRLLALYEPVALPVVFRRA